MSEKTIGTIEDYVKITTRDVTVSTGVTFKVRAMGAAATVGLMSRLPEGGLGDDNITPFIVENIDFIIADIIDPCILEPRVPSGQIRFSDVMDLLNAIMVLSGFGDDSHEVVESFPEQ